MTKLKKIFNSKTYPFIVLFLIMLVISMLKPINFGDDSFFSEVLLKGSGPYPDVTNIVDYLGVRYDTWTSRVIIEFFLVIFAGKLPLLWKLIDPLMYVIIAYSIKRVFLKDKDEKLNWILVLLVLLIPVSITKEAGAIATSLNYIWPVAFGLASLIPIRKCLDNEKIKWYEYLVYLPMMIFAVDSELVCACLLTTYIIFTIYLAIKKKLKPIIVILLLVSIISIIFAFRCPGNDARTEQETRLRFSDFENITFVDKLVIGLISEMNYYIFDFNALYFIFTLIVLLTIFKKYHDNILYKAIAVVPFILGIMFNIVPNILGHPVTNILESCRMPGQYINYNNFNNIPSYFPVALYCINIGLIFVNLYLIFGNSKKILISFLVLACGLCSRLIMGFMTTVFASGNRTQLILLVMFMALIMMLLEEKNKKFRDILLDFLIVFAIFFK